MCPFAASGFCVDAADTGADGVFENPNLSLINLVIILN
jgi:hypothetical protein